MKQNPMADIYAKLKPLGFDAAFLRRNILPEWWRDTLAAIPSNRQYAVMVLARQLGVTYSSLDDPTKPLERKCLHVRVCGQLASGGVKYGMSEEEA